MPLRNLPIKTGHLFLGLAVVMFIVTVMIFSGGKKEAPKVVAKIPTQEVVVPLVPISEGKTLSISDITSVKWPSEFLPKGATFEDTSQVVGRVAKQDLFPGEPIFAEKVSGSDTNGGLPAIIPKGMRAVSVAVTEVKGVAGFVKPGDRVDVLTTFEIEQEGGKSERKTRTVLQNVLVLASAQTMVNDNKYAIETPDGVTRGEAEVKAVESKDKDKNKKAEKPKSEGDLEKERKQREKEKKDAEKAARLVSSVTMALTPEQSEALALAEETGDIRLALRPETDHAIAEVNGISFNTLIGQEERKPVMKVSGSMPRPPKIPSPAPMMGRQVEFIQGTEKSTLQLQ
jgi:Flp pilus assembly protein CpaB